jgi:hypothetical protein
MTLPTVVEITPQLEAVTPDTFIDRWAAVAHAGKDPAATGLSLPIASAQRHTHQQKVQALGG